MRVINTIASRPSTTFTATIAMCMPTLKESSALRGAWPRNR